ncbi:hypothetical protein EF912_37925 [Streptomyces sp. WAC07061]|uniref:hypothetical protein n=1 Tax=Streptomyces sp. WAC07061 TaxID=2487410 RepID=UPI000F768C91|nr:hypothetical protein [Streptomyces sp. WAC07061]RSS32699.1 hypothetical protein EF912_37925 [Streptomyces sp. WAC07061]
MPYDVFTDRDERALVAAAEDRVCEPLRIGVALASARRLLAGLPPVRGKGRRESLTCQQSNVPAKPSPASPLPR